MGSKLHWPVQPIQPIIPFSVVILWPNQVNNLMCHPVVNLYISECCNFITVVGGGDVGQIQPQIFTTYIMEPDLLNGHVHYTSLDGRGAIAFNDVKKDWKIQAASRRYKWKHKIPMQSLLVTMTQLEI